MLRYQNTQMHTNTHARSHKQTKNNKSTHTSAANTAQWTLKIYGLNSFLLGVMIMLVDLIPIPLMWNFQYIHTNFVFLSGCLSHSLSVSLSQSILVLSISSVIWDYMKFNEMFNIFECVYLFARTKDLQIDQLLILYMRYISHFMQFENFKWISGCNLPPFLPL